LTVVGREKEKMNGRSTNGTRGGQLGGVWSNITGVGGPKGGRGEKWQDREVREISEEVQWTVIRQEETGVARGGSETQQKMGDEEKNAIS